MNVEVSILCAGRGSRLGSLTDAQPKCMVSFLDRPLIDYQLSIYEHLGIKNVTLITGYAHQALDGFSTRKIHNRDWKTTNMLQSFLMALDSAKSSSAPLLLAYSDIVFNQQCLDFLHSPPSLPTIPVNTKWRTLWQSRMDSPEEDAESLAMDESGHLLDIGGPIESIESVQGQFMGLVYLPASFKTAWHEDLSEYLKPLERRHHSTTEFLQHQVDVGQDIGTHKVDGGWLEVDSIKDLETYEQLHRESRLQVVSGWNHE